MKRAERNIEALELLNVLNTEWRWPTREEQQVLSGYTSWGAASQLFDRTRPEWATLRERLEKAVDEKTYRQMEEASLTAFFTDDEVIKPLWDALKQAGLSEGVVLEPGSGTGNFIGNAPQGLDVVGVEKEQVSASIAQLLYPQATVVHNGFEKVNFADDSFVAAIGNVPFGNFRLYDPEHNANSHSIHNHFILKSLDLVKPGGYVAVVTS